MTVNLSALAGAGQQFLDVNGNPLTGGKLYSYEAGTTTPQTTYTTVSGDVPHANPIILDSAGRVPGGQIWLTAGLNYKFVLTSSTDTSIGTWDNITGINGTGISTNASLIAFDPAGANAVATTVQAKLRETVSVKDFGAVGDGVTDDTAAIQAAVSAANRIYFPSGTYLCDGQIALRSNVTLCGDGMNVTKVKKVTTDYGGVFVANSDSTTEQIKNIVLQDLTVFDDVVTLGFSEQQHLVSLHGVDNVQINRVEFYGFRGDGLYIGEWNEAVRTRVNTNILVSDCVFDGVNKDNRNGISVITGDGITIVNNMFKNTTKSDMPGAIDLEPDASTTSIIKNVVVSGNRFFNIGGNVGAVCAVIPATVAEFQNITVTSNSFDTCGDIFAVVHQRSTTEYQNVIFSNNSATNSERSFVLTGATTRGVSISGNTFIGDSTGLLGFSTTDVVENAVISNNVFVNPTTNTEGAISLNGQVSGATISANVFTNWYDYCVLLGGNAADNISKIIVTGNIAKNTRNANRLVFAGSGTISGASCVYLNNIGAKNTSKFWRTDDCGEISNGTTATSFNSATLPDSFGEGTSMAVINGDTGVPNTGGYQGTLITVVPGDNIAKWTYQLYYPANNSVKVGSFYLRKRNTAANTWTSWYEIAGV